MAEAQTRLDEALQEKPRTSDTVSTLAKYGYIVGDIIGQGAYATVKKAYWKKKRATVAVKIMSIAQAGTSFIEKCVPRELEVIHKLQHENIIHFYEYIETTMRFYIIMRYAENGSLLNLIRKEGRLAEARARRYYRELLDALQYMHSRGYAHRDIKLENLVLDGSDRLKLIDFGFACRLRDEDSASSGNIPQQPHLSETFCGSHAYASPEILRFKPYDPVPADIWASGVVLYSLLFGQLPFSNKRNVREMLKIIARGVQFPSTVRVSQEVKYLLKQIFVPVGQRLTGALIRRSLWFFIELIEEEVARASQDQEFQARPARASDQVKRQKLNKD
ncbi:testis-specific serine/threonine-protein kinase 3-like [Anopheles stephensi]|uniref:Protein kinase domain-containing protein n=1 Tax=Anopheles stephensi TaxID=30069 RepID=A0A182YQK0_ANOST|nr:testis-specific serine/threonine-protein kinase 3-like [Anopheles stephensi]